MTKEQLIDIINSYDSCLTAEDILYKIIEYMTLYDINFLIDMFKLITSRVEHCMDNAVYATKLCEKCATQALICHDSKSDVNPQVPKNHIMFIKDLCSAFRTGKLNKVSMSALHRSVL